MPKNMNGTRKPMGEEMFKNIGGPLIDAIIVEHDSRIVQHAHSFYEMVYVLDGFTLHSCGGIIRILTAGDLFFVRPGESHSYLNTYQTKIYNCIFYADALGSLLNELRELPGVDLLFQETDAAENIKAAREAEWDRRILRVEVGKRRDVEYALGKIRGERENQQIGWQTSLKTKLASFLVLYSRLYAEQREQETGQNGDYFGYVYKILEYISENYQNEINMAQLSAVTNLSPDYMARRFKAVMHITPSEYVRKFRIAKAMELLCTTDLSIAEITAKTGFSDISLFSRVFKNAVGLPPITYKKSISCEEREMNYQTKQAEEKTDSAAAAPAPNTMCGCTPDGCR